MFSSGFWNGSLDVFEEPFADALDFLSGSGLFPVFCEGSVVELVVSGSAILV